MDHKVALFESNEKSSLLCSLRKGKFTNGHKLMGQRNGAYALIPKVVSYLFLPLHELWTRMILTCHFCSSFSKRHVMAGRKNHCFLPLLALHNLSQSTENSEVSFLQCLWRVFPVQEATTQRWHMNIPGFSLKASELLENLFSFAKNSELSGMLMRDWYLQN